MPFWEDGNVPRDGWKPSIGTFPSPGSLTIRWGCGHC